MSYLRQKLFLAGFVQNFVAYFVNETYTIFLKLTTVCMRIKFALKKYVTIVLRVF